MSVVNVYLVPLTSIIMKPSASAGKVTVTVTTLSADGSLIPISIGVSTLSTVNT